jgi:transcription elongation factor B polypeptide 3
MDNIDKLTMVGDAPYYLLKPVLQKCSPTQLLRIEEYNPQLEEECDELWHGHCRAEFRGLVPEEDETWKEFYVRSMQDRENRLKKITSSIGRKMAKEAEPVRKTVKMDSFAAGKMKNGRAQYQEASGSNPGLKPNMSSVKDRIHNARMATQAPIKGKPKAAPLMAKALMSMKSRFRR